MRWVVVMFYGEGPNDYTEEYGLTERQARLRLIRAGYRYVTTYGNERVYAHDLNGLGSMVPDTED